MRRRCALLLPLAATLAGACAPGDAPVAAPSDADVLAATTERGPVAVTLTFEPRAPWLSDEPTLTIDVAAEDGVEVEMPPFREDLGGFRVHAFEEPPPRVEAGRAVARQIYRLEPLVAGPHVVPPLPVSFVDRRANGDGEAHELQTELLEVTIRSLVEGDAPSLADLRPPKEAVRLPVPRPFPWSATILAAAGVLGLIVVLFVLRRRRARPAEERELTPSERADRELRSLLEDDPLARGEMQSFYVELTLVVRRFIERSTGVRAPEQTTAEFLRAMRTHEAFDAAARRRLRDFLEAADLVKFAGVRPPREDIEESFRRAQEFAGLPGTLALRAGENPS